jgi:hypothetical protein
MKNFIEIAADAAKELEEEYADKPEVEFIAWLFIALQRESMVAVAYDDSFVEGQLVEWQKEYGLSQKVIDAIRRALRGVWSQEKAHQSYFKAMLSGIDPPEKLVDRIYNKMSAIRGRVEGRVLGGVMSKKLSQRAYALVAIALGNSIDKVPEYVSSLRETNFSQYCHVNADLEQTAVMGYQRMVELGTSIPDSDIISESAILVDLKRTGNDEKYHERLFRTLGNWPPPPPGGTPTVYNPLGPATAQPDKMTVEEARGIIAEAKKFAYGDDASVGDTVVTVNNRLIYNDPLIQYLKKYAVKAIEDEGQKTMYMSAGM